MTEEKQKKPKTSKGKEKEIERLDDLIDKLESENAALDKLLKGLISENRDEAEDEKNNDK